MQFPEEKIGMPLTPKRRMQKRALKKSPIFKPPNTGDIEDFDEEEDDSYSQQDYSHRLREAQTQALLTASQKKKKKKHSNQDAPKLGCAYKTALSLAILKDLADIVLTPLSVSVAPALASILGILLSILIAFILIFARASAKKKAADKFTKQMLVLLLGTGAEVVSLGALPAETISVLIIGLLIKQEQMQLAKQPA